jgi:hypothetical protein
MGFRDRFYTPRTAKAILSWRIVLGVAVGVVAAFAGAPVILAVVAGAAVYTASVGAAMPRAAKRPTIDPFVLSEPWRQLMQSAQSSGRKLRATVDSTSSGPLRDQLESIVDQLQRGLGEAWEIARRGDAIDDEVRRIDPTALRSKLETLRRQADANPTDEANLAVRSVERQLESADRLKQQSEQTAASLRLSQTQLDELVARASEVRVGTFDTDDYAKDVDDLVIELEALHQAVAETREQ